MERSYVLQKLNHANALWAKIKLTGKFRKTALVVSTVLHFLMYLPYLGSLAAVYFPPERFSISDIPILKDIITLYPTYSGAHDIVSAGVVSIFLIPLVIGIIIAVIGDFIKPKTVPINDQDSLKDSAKYHSDVLQVCYDNDLFENRLVKSGVASAVIILMFIFCMLKANPLIFAKDESAGANILYGLLYGTIAMLCLVPVLSIILFIFALMQKLICIPNPSFANEVKAAKKECGELFKELKAEEIELKEAKAKALAAEAEAKWQELDAPEENLPIVYELAENGSPSACLFMGRYKFQDSIMNPHTQKEKNSLLSRAKKYLKVAIDGNDSSEAKFLLLSIRAQYENHNKEEWLEMLEEARSLKHWGKLDEAYDEAMDVLIKSIISVVDKY